MKQFTEYPDFVARFYDVVYGSLRTDDVAYFLRKITEAHGPVLEVGVGTGRFFVEALNRGVDIYGIDVNASMIKRLEEKINPKQHHRVTVQDARDFTYPTKFELILLPFRVFSHLLTTDDQIKALDCIYRHLNDGGFCIFDLFVPDLDLLMRGLNKVVDFDGEYAPGKRLRRIVSTRADLIEQISHVTMEFCWQEHGGERQETWTFPIRYFFRFELEHLVRRSKLHLCSIFGDFQEGPLDSQSKDFIVVCQRKQA